MTAVPASPLPTANERLKARWPSVLWGSLTVATLLHALVFALWPTGSVAAWGVTPDSVVLIHVPEIDIPEPPEVLNRPAPPVAADVPDDVTADITPWSDAVPAPTPPPPPPGAEPDAPGGFTPYTVAPRILNPAVVTRALEREYPAPLRDAGVGGTVVVALELSATGEVLSAEIGESSGYASLDRAALRVADVLRMSPALNRDRAVAVWIRLPLTFRTR